MTKAMGSVFPLPLWERVVPSEAKNRVRGLLLKKDPSPGSHLKVLATLSHKGRGEKEHAVLPYAVAPRALGRRRCSSRRGISSTKLQGRVR